MNGSKAAEPIPNCSLPKTTKPPPGMIVPAGMRNLRGFCKLSVKNQPLISAGAIERFCSSIFCGDPTGGCVRISLTATRGSKRFGTESPIPGEPPSRALGCQPDPSLKSFPATVSNRGTNENPAPSVTGYQPSLNL